MDGPTAGLLIFSVVAGLVLLVALRNQRRRAKRIKEAYKNLEGEEERMFCFLHDLGLAIAHEPSDVALSRMIVDGVMDVVGGKGGVIYYLSEGGKSLIPAYVSDSCPPMVSVPGDVLERARVDKRALGSHMMLTRVGLGKGLIGRAVGATEAVFEKSLREGGMMGEEVDFLGEDFSVMVSPLRYAGKEIGVLAVARGYGDGVFSLNDFAVFRSVAEQSSFAIGNARVHREANEKRVIEGELRNAREVQRVLLPQEEPVVRGFRVSGMNLPARFISGDYYDYIELSDGKLGVVVADVSGKGVSAGLLMAMCRSLLRAVSQKNDSPAAVLAEVNRYLYLDIREDMFISLIYGILDSESGQFTFARAGHDPALVSRKASGVVETFRPKGMALGIDGGDVFERVTKDEVVELVSGDCVLLFTDGVKEALNHDGEEFGMERLAEVFREAAVLGAEASVKRVEQAVERYTGEGPQMDDITIVAIERR
jgi:phosphoserine phosphatase RsbU/P